MNDYPLSEMSCFFQLVIESLKDYIIVQTTDGSFVTHQRLIHTTKLLPGNKFVRIHRSFTFSLEMVTPINGKSLEIMEHLLPIGKNYHQEVKNLIFNSCIKQSQTTTIFPVKMLFFSQDNPRNMNYTIYDELELSESNQHMSIWQMPIPAN